MFEIIKELLYDFYLVWRSKKLAPNHRSTKSNKHPVLGKLFSRNESHIVPHNLRTNNPTSVKWIHFFELADILKLWMVEDSLWHRTVKRWAAAWPSFRPCLHPQRSSSCTPLGWQQVYNIPVRENIEFSSLCLLALKGQRCPAGLWFLLLVGCVYFILSNTCSFRQSSWWWAGLQLASGGKTFSTMDLYGKPLVH